MIYKLEYNKDGHSAIYDEDNYLIRDDIPPYEAENFLTPR